MEKSQNLKPLLHNVGTSIADMEIAWLVSLNVTQSWYPELNEIFFSGA